MKVQFTQASRPMRGVVTPVNAHWVALAAAFAWGVSSVPHKTIADHLDGFTATGLTCLVGALVLAPLANRESLKARSDQKTDLWLALKVTLFFALAATLQQFGFIHTTVTNAGFLVNTVAVITPVVAWIFYRQRPSLKIALASIVTLSGIVLLTEGGLEHFSWGAGLCLASALCYAFWTLAVGQHVLRCQAPFMLTFIQLLITGVVTLVIGLTVYLPLPSSILAALPEIVIIGVMGKGVAYALNAVAQQHLSASCTAVIVSAEAVFGAMFAFWLLGETLTSVRACGAGLIILGVFVASRSQSR
jgi:drug/metabolite transporter (DMT)-like permease